MEKSKKEIKPEIVEKARKAIERTRAKLLLKQPFYGVLLSMADITATTDIPTMATDGIRIWYNPEFTAKLEENEVNGVMMHEISHCVYMHMNRKRRLNREHKRWNISADFAINLEISALGPHYKLPNDCLLDKKYENMNAEMIYDALPKNIDNMETMDTHIEPMDGTEDWDEMKDKIISAYEMSKDAYDSKQQGRLPEGLRRWIDKMRQSKVKWERIFHRFVGQALAKDDFSYTRCNRRYMGQDIYLPDLRNHIIGNVVLAIDTSGSITKEILEQFSAELAKVSYLIEQVTVMTCDAEVHEIVKINKMSDFMKKLQFKGGGGTDFRPPFNKVKELKLAPELFLYLTDLMGIFPEKRPEYPVLWCVVGDYETKPPFGEYINIPIKEG